MPGRLPIPSDFRDHALEKNRELVARYGVHQSTIAKWRNAIGVKAWFGGKTPMPPPRGFAKLAAVTPIEKLVAHYSHDRKTIRRWLTELGITPPSGRPQRKEPARQVKIQPSPKGRMVLPAAPRQAAIPSGLDEDAAHFLRRVYACVHHCNERGGADPKGKFWRCGTAVLSADELMARARRRGWNPDSWREIAA